MEQVMNYLPWIGVAIVVVPYDQYVVSLYGDEELVNTFRDKFTATYSDSTIAYDEAIL